MYLSEGTVRNCLSTAIKKLGSRNRVETVRLAERRAGSRESAADQMDRANRGPLEHIVSKPILGKTGSDVDSETEKETRNDGDRVAEANDRGTLHRR